MSENHSAAGFPTTNWSRVARAGDPRDVDGHASLAALCRDYWYPLYAYARRKGLTSDDASDLVQGFLADLIERGDLATADQNKGRFRSFLRAACGHYLSHKLEHDRAIKRGGLRRQISFDSLEAEGRYAREPSHDLTAERLFERRWALTILDGVLTSLMSEMTAAGKADLFARLRPTLEGDRRAESYREIGEALGMSDGSVKVASHRLRRRYRELLREEVGRTVADPLEIDHEISELLASLSG